MCNNGHFLISLLLVGGLVLLDFVPQVRDLRREKPAVCFAALCYAFAAAIGLAAGFGARMNTALGLLSTLAPLYRFLGGDVQ